MLEQSTNGSAVTDIDLKILLIGAKGTIGSAIDRELSARHEIVRIGRKSGDFQVDISDSASIRKLFEQTGRFDALICAAGNVKFAALDRKSTRLNSSHNSPSRMPSSA